LALAAALGASADDPQEHAAARQQERQQCAGTADRTEAGLAGPHLDVAHRGDDHPAAPAPARAALRAAPAAPPAPAAKTPPCPGNGDDRDPVTLHRIAEDRGSAGVHPYLFRETLEERLPMARLEIEFADWTRVHRVDPSLAAHGTL